MKIKATRIQWIKFAVVLVLWLAFIIWLKSWLGLIVIPFIFDAYITKKIPWSWWKKSKNPAVVSVMSWVDAIVYAGVAVYFVNLFFFQNYVIPSSSLEKSLLVGDYLFVSKMSYGGRIPQTPLHMPLTQHTIPGLNCKSYLEWPKWDYKRVDGLTGTAQRYCGVQFPGGRYGSRQRSGGRHLSPEHPGREGTDQTDGFGLAQPRAATGGVRSLLPDGASLYK